MRLDTQSLVRDDGAVQRRLAFIVLANLLVVGGMLGAAISASGASEGQPVPPLEVRRIKAEYGPPHLPVFAPRGFIFTSWKIDPAPFQYLSDTLRVTFGRSGTLLMWSVSDGRNEQTYARCNPPPSSGNRRRINGRTIYYARGNHGDSAWACLKSRSVGIDLWIQNGRGRPSVSTAMRMVASARRY